MKHFSLAACAKGTWQELVPLTVPVDDGSKGEIIHSVQNFTARNLDRSQSICQQPHRSTSNRPVTSEQHNYFNIFQKELKRCNIMMTI